MQGRPGAQQQYKKCAKLSAVIRSKLFLHKHDNNTHEAEQALPAWRGAGRSSRGTRPLLSSSGGARSFREPHQAAATRQAGRSSRRTRPLLSSSDGARNCRNRPRCLLRKAKKNKRKQHLRSALKNFSGKVLSPKRWHILNSILHNVAGTYTKKRTNVFKKSVRQRYTVRGMIIKGE